jgi:hypothetical protein
LVGRITVRSPATAIGKVLESLDAITDPQIRLIDDEKIKTKKIFAVMFKKLNVQVFFNIDFL